jgi:Cadherin domain
VPLIIQLIDVNDESPVFEKPLYEFILTADLKNFTIPAFIKAIDGDAEAPNNIVRYEIIHGNYENKFALNEVTGQLMLREPLVKRSKRQANSQKPEVDVYVLTARAFDLGVPVRFSTTTVRIYPPESRARVVTFLVPGYAHDRKKLEDQLSTLTGGRVVIQDIKPHIEQGAVSTGSNREEKSEVTATVIYDSNTLVDVDAIKKRVMQDNSQDIVVYEDAVSQATFLEAEQQKILKPQKLFLSLLRAPTKRRTACCSGC